MLSFICAELSTAIADSSLEFLPDLLGNLARRYPRQFIHDMELAGYLIEGQIVLQELLELADIDLCSLMDTVEAGTDLTAELILNANDSHLMNPGELVDKLLDLARIDIFAHADNHILDAVDNVDIAIFVGSGHIARMEPATAHDIMRHIGKIPIAKYHIIAFDDKLAQLAARNLLSLVIDEFPQEPTFVLPSFWPVNSYRQTGRPSIAIKSASFSTTSLTL